MRNVIYAKRLKAEKIFSAPGEGAGGMGGGGEEEGGSHFLDPMIVKAGRLRLIGVPFSSFRYIKRYIILELKNKIGWENQSFSI